MIAFVPLSSLLDWKSVLRVMHNWLNRAQDEPTFITANSRRESMTNRRTVHQCCVQNTVAVYDRQTVSLIQTFAHTPAPDLSLESRSMKRIHSMSLETRIANVVTADGAESTSSTNFPTHAQARCEFHTGRLQRSRVGRMIHRNDILDPVVTSQNTPERRSVQQSKPLRLSWSRERVIKRNRP